MSFRHFECGFVGLGSGIAKKYARQTAGAGKALGQWSRVLVIVTVGAMDQASHLLTNYFGEARVRVAQGVHADTGDQIEIALAGRIVDVTPFSTLQHYRVARVILEQVLLFQIDNRGR